MDGFNIISSNLKETYQVFSLAQKLILENLFSSPPPLRAPARCLLQDQNLFSQLQGKNLTNFPVQNWHAEFK